MTTTILSTVNFGAIGLAFSSLIITMVEPLFRVANHYNVHLFPDRDQIDYTISNLHYTSQNLHIAAAVFLGLAFMFSFAETVSEYLSINENKITNFKIMETVNVVIGGCLYIAGTITLGKVGQCIKDKLDHLPIPIPDVDIKVCWGGIFDGIGMFSVLLAIILTITLIIKNQKRRTRYVALP